MAGPALTPDEFELHLRDLEQRLDDYLERGEGKSGELLRLGEELLGMREAYPDVWNRHGRVEGMLADVLARRQRDKVVASQEPTEERPGCLIGWLLGRGRRNGE